MTYEYESKRGDRLEWDFPLGQAPDIIVNCGRRYRRVISKVQVLIPETFKSHWNDEREINRSLDKELIDSIERKQSVSAAASEAARQELGG